MIKALIRRLAALGLLGSALVALHLAGSAIVHPPIDELGAWIDHDPVAVAMTFVRWTAMAVGCWLAAVTLADTLALGLRLHPLRRLTTNLAPSAWRSLVLRPVALATLVIPPVAMPVATALPAMAATAPASDHETVVPQLEMTSYERDRPLLTMTLVLSDEDRAPVVESPAEPTPPGENEIADGIPPAAVHTVQPGENLWSIAAAHLEATSGQVPAPHEITAYWRSVIDANRETLPDPGNPDLIYQGISLAMPLVG